MCTRVALSSALCDMTHILGLPFHCWQDQIQRVIDAGLVPPLVQLLATAEFDIKKVCPLDLGSGLVVMHCV
jgi:hypothetical protein